MFTGVCVIVVCSAYSLVVVVVLSLREPVPEDVSDVRAEADTNVLSSVEMLEGFGMVGLGHGCWFKVASLGLHCSSSSQFTIPELRGGKKKSKISVVGVH